VKEEEEDKIEEEEVEEEGVAGTAERSMAAPVCAAFPIDACHVPTMIIHSRPPFKSTKPNRDALGRKVEADVEAKTDFNALKNQWDSIEKDFHTWSKEVSRGGGGREGGNDASKYEP